MIALLTIVILTAIYAAVIIGLAASLRRLGVGGDRSIVLGFFIFGGVSGLLATRVWPVESSIYCNVPAVLLGDMLYSMSIEYLGGSHSANAHETIPWILRIPQVYAPVSLAVSVIAGWCVQSVYNRTRANLRGR